MKRRNFVGVLIGALLAPFVARPSPAVTYAEMERAYEACVAPGDEDFIYRPIEGGLYKPGDPFVISRQRAH